MIYKIMFYSFVAGSYARALFEGDPDRLMISHFVSFLCMVIFCPIFPYNEENKKEE